MENQSMQDVLNTLSLPSELSLPALHDVHNHTHTAAIWKILLLVLGVVVVVLLVLFIVRKCMCKPAQPNAGRRVLDAVDGGKWPSSTKPKKTLPKSPYVSQKSRPPKKVRFENPPSTGIHPPPANYSAKKSTILVPDLPVTKLSEVLKGDIRTEFATEVASVRGVDIASMGVDAFINHEIPNLEDPLARRSATPVMMSLERNASSVPGLMLPVMIGADEKVVPVLPSNIKTNIADMAFMGDNILLFLVEDSGDIIVRRLDGVIGYMRTDLHMDHIAVFRKRLYGLANGVLHEMSNFVKVTGETSSDSLVLPAVGHWVEVAGVSAQILSVAASPEDEFLILQNLEGVLFVDENMQVQLDRTTKLRRVYGHSLDTYIDINEETGDATDSAGNTYDNVADAVHLNNKPLLVSQHEQFGGVKRIYNHAGRVYYLQKQAIV